MQDNNKSIIVRIENFTYKYPDGTVALQNINLIIEEGETLCVLGPNGAGKTTLLLAIAGAFGNIPQIEVYPGKIIDKNDFSKIGFLFQNPDDQLFSLRVKDEIAFALHNLKIPHQQILERVTEIMSKLNLNISDDKEVINLSFGQKRKVALASILVYCPDLLLLDEPTYGLDPRSIDEFEQIIKQLQAENKTIVIATHDVDFAKQVSSKAAVLSEDHKLVAYGQANTIFSDIHLLYRSNLIRRKNFQGYL
ncbi:MAG: energy-coupling factor ABC transporter ATP-binding protein [Planctomycetota bacterium]